MRKLVPQAARRSKARPVRSRPAPARRKEANMHWARPELVAEIEFAGWTGDGNVRQAAFKGLRADKPAEEVEAEQAVKPEKAKMAKPVPEGANARSLPVPKRPIGRAVVMGVSISNPDKPLWPDEKPPVTKLELARILRGGRRLDDRASQGPALLDRAHARRHRRRPEVLPAPRRARHVPSARAGEGERRSQALPADRPRRGPGRGGPARRAPSCIPWNCQPDKPDLPGRLVFDLDPAPDVEFGEVIKGALEVAQAAGGAGAGDLLQDHGRQGPACRHAADLRPEESGLGCRQDLRPRDLPAAGRGRARPLRAQHGQEGARRPHLPRLSAQRPHRDGRGAAVAARAGGRHGVDAAQLAAGEGGPRSHEVHRPHRAGAAEEEQAVGDLRQVGDAAARGHRTPDQSPSREDTMAKARRKTSAARARKSGRCARPGRDICGCRW